MSYPTEGRLEIVTDAGQDAVDGGGTIDAGACVRTAKARGPDTLTPVSSQQRQTAGDGGNRAGLTGEIAR